MLTAREHRRLADVLLKARRERRLIRPFTDTYPELTIVDAELIRESLVSRTGGGGGKLIGAGIHADESEVDGRDTVGLLMDDMLLDSEEVDAGSLIRPHVEAKVALVMDLGRRAAGEPPAAVIQVLPTLEVVDSGFIAGCARRLDAIAENFGARSIRLGPGLSPAEVRFDRVVVTLEGSEPTRSAFAGWYRLLTDDVRRYSSRLKTSDLLLSPALATSSSFDRGSRLDCDFGQLGRLRLDAF